MMFNQFSRRFLFLSLFELQKLFFKKNLNEKIWMTLQAQKQEKRVLRSTLSAMFTQNLLSEQRRSNTKKGTLRNNYENLLINFIFVEININEWWWIIKEKKTIKRWSLKPF